jgi:hypothetical protein
MLTNGNLNQYLQQGLAPPFLGLTGGAALPQFNPQGIYGPLGMLGANLPSGQELGPYATSWTTYAGAVNPAQQVVFCSPSKRGSEGPRRWPCACAVPEGLQNRSIGSDLVKAVRARRAAATGRAGICLRAFAAEKS